MVKETDQESSVPPEPEASAAEPADTSPGAEPAPAPAGRNRGRRTPLIIAGAIVAAAILLIMGIDAVATSPTVCASCHEMQPWVASWRVSPHAEVACYACHQQPRQWYGQPLALVERWTKLAGQVRTHYASSSEPATISAVGAPPIPDAACEQCHDPARVGTSRFGVQIQHADHARRNKSCVSCHRFTAHPVPGTDRDTEFMKQCFTCHSIVPGSRAPGECSVCHLKGVDLHPDSHKGGGWLTRHGKIAIADRKQCSMCHADEFCIKCHGLVMPHPAGWAKGKNNHATAATKDRTVCEKCHTGTKNLCTMCHHMGYNEDKGPWVLEHKVLAGEKGPAFCFQCHESTFCTDCHKTNGSAPSTQTP